MKDFFQEFTALFLTICTVVVFVKWGWAAALVGVIAFIVFTIFIALMVGVLGVVYEAWRFKKWSYQREND